MPQLSPAGGFHSAHSGAKIFPLAAWRLNAVIAGGAATAQSSTCRSVVPFGETTVRPPPSRRARPSGSPPEDASTTDSTSASMAISCDHTHATGPGSVHFKQRHALARTHRVGIQASDTEEARARQNEARVWPGADDSHAARACSHRQNERASCAYMSCNRLHTGGRAWHGDTARHDDVLQLLCCRTRRMHRRRERAHADLAALVRSDERRAGGADPRGRQQLHWRAIARRHQRCDRASLCGRPGGSAG